MFQSTHPHGVRPLMYYNMTGNIVFQSTHPHGVRHFALPEYDRLGFVSIHAPTRGATTKNRRHQNAMLVSIHAPTRGATYHRCSQSHGIVGFNPRTHTGCDFALSNIKIYMYVSIHAPTRGATYKSSRKKFVVNVSIHAPTRGATRPNLTNLYNKVFQSTHPHGVRHNVDYMAGKSNMFQSTHPHGVRRRVFSVAV